MNGRETTLFSSSCGIPGGCFNDAKITFRYHDENGKVDYFNITSVAGYEYKAPWSRYVGYQKVKYCVNDVCVGDHFRSTTPQYIGRFKFTIKWRNDDRFISIECTDL